MTILVVVLNAILNAKPVQLMINVEEVVLTLLETQEIIANVVKDTLKKDSRNAHVIFIYLINLYKFII